MFPGTSSATRASAVLLCFLGLFVLTGWAIGSETMVRLIPGSVAMSINTAIMFLVGGLALASARRVGPWAGRLHRTLASVLVVLPLLILSQHIFDIDLGIDLASVHAALRDGHAKPGRTAPNACLGFLCAGIALLATRRAPRDQVAYVAALVLGVFVFTIGASAFLGYLLALDMLYQFASYNRMAALTALGMTVLGAAVWHFTAAHCNPDTSRERNEAKRVTTLAAILLVVFALSTGLASFGLLKNSFERTAITDITRTTRTSAISVSALLNKAIQLSQSVSSRPALRATLATLAADPGDAGARRQLDDELRNLAALGFSVVRFEDAAGGVIAAAGSARGEPQLRVPIGTPEQASELLWRDGFVIRSSHAVVDDGVQVGRLVLENPMPAFSAFVAEAQRIAESSDVLLCVRERNEAACFPSRFYPVSYRFPLFKPDGTALYPVTLALAGETGARIVKDARGLTVLAGYAALPGYNMALVEKIDVMELYAPLRSRLPVLLAVVLAFVVAGTLLLSRWVRPLVAQIATERHRMKLVLDHSSDAFIALDAAGRICEWNPQAERILGWTAADACGLDAGSLLIVPGEHGDLSRVLAQGARRGLSERFETFARRKTGEPIPVEVSVTTYSDGKGYAASIFIRDLTGPRAAARELDAARAALAQSQKLEAIGKLTGGVAHDFNNVLQVVKGSLQLLRAENADSARLDKRTGTALGAVDRGAKLASQLLAFARKQPLQPQVLDVGRVVSDMGDMLQRALGEAVDVKTIVTAGLWNAFADRHQLEQVILNLAINARDAMQGEGKLTIEVDNARLEDDYVRAEPGLKAGQYVMLAVSDTGCGMTREVMERVFEPFFTTKPEGVGTGLGLSMAYGFVKQSGGHIRIYSEVGHGSTIRVYLPRSLECAQEQPAVLQEAIRGGSETILVVEDDPSVQETAIDLLSGLGYRVLKADNASDALALLEGGATVDLLFTDVVMPGPLRSPELAARARELLPRVKVLYTSGYTQNAIVHGGRLDPGVKLLSKPYGRDELARKVRELLDSSGEDADQSTAPPETGLRIAFVEDNEDFRTVGSELLALLGHRVDAFGSAEDALEGLAQRHYDVLITDLTLPGMSGVELAARAYALMPQMRIVVASGYGGRLDPEPAFPYVGLTKPFVLADLQQALQMDDAGSCVR